MAKSLTGAKWYVCATPAENDLTQAEFEALTWVEVKNVGSVGELGPKTNVISYDELGSDVTQKSKGLTDAGSPAVECARNPTDAGQLAMRTATKTNFNYPFKYEKNDAPNVTKTNTIHYNRGVVTGPLRPNGGNEDFDLEIFTCAMNQLEITVDPEDV